MDGHGHVADGRRELGADEGGEGPGDEVGRRRLDADLREHEGAGLFRRAFVLFEHLGDEGHLARHVEVVRAILGASLEGVLAQLAVGPNGGDEDEGLLGEGSQVRVGQTADLNPGLDTVRVELLALSNQVLQLGLRAPCYGPLEVGGQVGGDVLGRVLPRVAWLDQICARCCE
jgi:hypothetical protein